MPKGPKLVDGKLVYPDYAAAELESPFFSRNGNGVTEICRRSEQLAVNVPDLMRVNPLVRGMLLGGKLDERTPVLVDPNRMDEIGALFICDLLTAALCCDLLRSENRKSSTPPIRVYLKREGGSWARVPRGQLLTVLKDGKAVLSPEVFREEVKLVDLSIVGPKTFMIDGDAEDYEEEER